MMQVPPLSLIADQTEYLDKRRVAQSFSAAAQSYDSVAQLQRDIGERLLTHLPNVLDQPQSSGICLDIGSGTGYFSNALADRLPQACILSLDIAHGMLEFARQQRPMTNGQWVCGDAEALPLHNDSVDLAFSSLAIQWCQQPDKLFHEVARVLKPGGCFYFSTLGPRTLFELKHAWAQVDDKVHVNHFIDWSELSFAATQGFAAHAASQGDIIGCELLSLEQFETTLNYLKVTELTSELKTLGAHNVNQGQSSGLTGRARFKALLSGYEVFRTADGQLPATYDVYLGCVRKRK